MPLPDRANPRYRSRFHLQPPRGWMNDPNGLSRFGGRYHLFYQHNPADSVWGPMHWGHAASEDLVEWEDLPVALGPGEAYDSGGCYSGSAVRDGEDHVLMYTGHVDPPRAAGAAPREVQCLARGDGRSYRKFGGNPVIDASLLPEGASSADFRDPKLWRCGDAWSCLVANRGREGGRLLAFRSRDLVRWEYLGTAIGEDAFAAGMYECPDYSRVGDRDLLLWCATELPPGRLAARTNHAALWLAGTLDSRTCSFAPSSTARELDAGPDFYAPQTVEAPDGRIILIGWLQSWGRSIPTHGLGHGWAGRMTIPRELSWSGPELAQSPVRELLGYRSTRRREWEGALRSGDRRAALEGDCLDLEVLLEGGGARRVGLSVLAGDGERTDIAWDPGAGALILDRSRSGHPISASGDRELECSVFRASLEPGLPRLDLRIVVDVSAIEVFALGGTVAMSATVYPRGDSDRLEAWAEGGAARVSIRGWKLLGRGEGDGPE